MRAQTRAAALDFLGLGDGFDYTQGSYSLGWRFTAKHDLQVTELGFYDDGKNGLTESHRVGIYDVGTKQLLVSATVVPTDPLTGFFRYHPITPTTLPGGRDYYVLAVTGTERYAVGVSDLVVDSGISFVGFAVNYENSDTQELLYPDTEEAGFNGDFGPSFKISNANLPSAAVDMPELTGVDVNDGYFSVGYWFRPTRDIKVSTLGYYDDNGDGFKQSQQVIIFDSLTKQAVVQAVITSNNPRRGYFRYQRVAPVTLVQNADYFIMGTTGSDNYRRDVTRVTVHPFIDLRGSAFNNQPPSLGPAFPTETHAGETPFFGPTFELNGPPQPLNISTRILLPPPAVGPPAAIGGFIVGLPGIAAHKGGKAASSGGAKKVLIRALGPSLPIEGKLQDPTVELFHGDTSLAFNDNWKDTQQSEIEASTIPPSDDREAAIVATLESDAYTAILRGSGDASGTGLIEIYDLDADGDAKLANISTRGFVGTSTDGSGGAAENQDAPMIGGFIVGSSSRYVIRAIGPSMASGGVSNALQDPTLEVIDGNGSSVASNDNWQDSQPAEIEATGIPPTDSRESAIVADFQSGPYTAVVRGQGGTSGVGLVEVYNIE